MQQSRQMSGKGNSQNGSASSKASKKSAGQRPREGSITPNPSTNLPSELPYVSRVGIVGAEHLSGRNLDVVPVEVRIGKALIQANVVFPNYLREKSEERQRRWVLDALADDGVIKVSIPMLMDSEDEQS